MTNKEKLGIILGSSLLSAYLAVFIYQRIQRAKADKSVVSEDEALKILNEKSYTTEPDFSEDELLPQLPNDEVVFNQEDSLKQFEMESGFGDY